MNNLLETILASGLAVFIYMNIVFIISLIIKRNDIADVAWGFGFVVASFAGAVFNKNSSLPVLLLLTMVSLWGLRLTIHIGLRNIKKSEDFRYKAWRESWGRWFKVRSYIQVYIMQGLLMLVVVSPVLIATTVKSKDLGVISVLAVALWLFGFIFESIGDWQLQRFVKNPNNKGRIIQNGLWRYTRHPNYFGEVTQWWAIGIFALIHSNSLLTLIGPATITFLILKVSGIPLLEKKYQNSRDYQEYKLKTSSFIPMPPRKLANK